jgi:hypothetical protein
LQEVAAAAGGATAQELHGLEHQVLGPPHLEREVVVEAPKLQAGQLVQPTPPLSHLVRRVQRVRVAMVLYLQRVVVVGGTVVVAVALAAGMSARVAQGLPT